jgi:ABC-type Fe3+ transport system permease subunit
MNFFQRTFQRQPVDEADQARREAAYQRGRADGRGDINDRGALSEHDSAMRRAYERGRRDERATRHPRRRGSPVFATVVVLALCAGAFVVYLGVSQGSFTNGGQVVDQNIANAKAQAQQAGRNAVDSAGNALENAGQTLKQKSGNS